MSRVSSRVPALFAAVWKSGRRRYVAQALPLHQGVGKGHHRCLTIHHRVYPRLVWEITRDVQLLPGVPDRFCWRWSNDNLYSAASAYSAMFIGSSRPVGAKQLWKTSAPPRVEFFFWLLLHGRCWTAVRRWRPGLQSTNEHILCAQASETMDHLLLECVFTREIWSVVLRKLHLDVKRTCSLGGSRQGNQFPSSRGRGLIRWCS